MKHVDISLNRILTTTPLWIMACVKDDNCCNPQNTFDAIMIGNRQGDDTFVAYQPMGILVSGETELTFSKDVYSPSPILPCYPVLLQFYHAFNDGIRNRRLGADYSNMGFTHQLLINYLITKSGVVTGKSQTEPSSYWPHYRSVNTVGRGMRFSCNDRMVKVIKLFTIWHT